MSVQTTAKEKLNNNGNGRKEAPIYALVKSQQKGFEMALPKGFDPSRFTRIALTAIKNNPKLQQCDPYSVLGGLMLSAQLGLEPNSPLHEASLIPYGKKADFQIEYRGLLKLVWNSGLISYMDFDIIRENDEWELEKGFEQKFVHKPNFKEDRGEAIAYYAIAELKGGGKVMHIMSKKEVIAHGKKFSKTFGAGPWQTDFDAMGLKTVIKQLADKKLPKRTTDEAIRFATALDKDEVTTSIDPSKLGKEIDIDDIETKHTYDDAADADVTEESEEEKIAKWENPEAVVEMITNLYNEELTGQDNLKGFNTWRKENKAKLEVFSGPDAEAIKAAISNFEKRALEANQK